MKKLTTKEFIVRAKIIHGDRYDYSISIYNGSKSKLIIICKIHGEFEQLPSNHLKGNNCYLCSLIQKTKTTQKFIEEASSKHDNKYDYSETIYTNNHTKIKIICLIHGIFEQIPSDHLIHGCNQCAIQQRAKDLSYTKEEFIIKSQQIHGEKYNYSLVNYTNSKQLVEIICNKHGSFLQKPIYHLMGCDCPICAKAGTSKAEQDWLNYLNIPVNQRQINIKIGNKRVAVDGFDPITNTVYEYNGDFWHGNPLIYDREDYNDVCNQTFGELYDKTIERENLLKSAGYHLMIKWETEIHNI